MHIKNKNTFCVYILFQNSMPSEHNIVHVFLRIWLRSDHIFWPQFKMYDVLASFMAEFIV